MYELVLVKKWMTRPELDDLLSPDAMTKPRGMPGERKQGERRGSPG